MQALEHPELHWGLCSLCPVVRDWKQRRHPALGSSIPALGDPPPFSNLGLPFPKAVMWPVCPPIPRDVE